MLRSLGSGLPSVVLSISWLFFRPACGLVWLGLAQPDRVFRFRSRLSPQNFDRGPFLAFSAIFVCLVPHSVYTRIQRFGKSAPGPAFAPALPAVRFQVGPIFSETAPAITSFERRDICSVQLHSAMQASAAVQGRKGRRETTERKRSHQIQLRSGVHHRHCSAFSFVYSRNICLPFGSREQMGLWAPMMSLAPFFSSFCSFAHDASGLER